MFYRCNTCGRLFHKKVKNSSIFEQLMCPKCLANVIKYKTTLGIGVLHYRESTDTVINALRTIDTQVGFDFNNLTVLVVTDGGGNKLDEDLISSNLINIVPKYIYKNENRHCAGTRNTIINTLTTDYIMFMDCDDELCNKRALSKIYNQINLRKPDLYCSSMLEELYNGKCLKYTNLMGLHMCHGKAYKRKFLLDNHILFDETIRVSEDIGFNTYIYDITDNIIFDHKLISYKWKYNKGSLTRESDETLKLDSYFRCFEDALTEFNKWFNQITIRNNYINKIMVCYLYNLLYYRIQLTKFKDKNIKEKYLKWYFDFVIPEFLDFNLLNKIDKALNRRLLRNILPFKKAYEKYKDNL